MSDSPSYDVGHGKPPEAHRYHVGKSGNPAGRPKGSKNLATLISQAAYDKITVTQKDGVKRKLRRIEAAFVQLGTKAAQGDHRAMTSLIDLLADVEQKAAAAKPADMHLGEKELAVLQLVHARMSACVSPHSEY